MISCTKSRATLLAFIAFMVMPSGSLTQEFSGDIDCYKCMGEDGNSSCYDFVNITQADTDIEVKTCRGGVCVKWTRYKDGKLMLERTCSADLNLNLLISNGCRRERSGNGYLCMCVSHYCNSAPPSANAVLWKYFILILMVMAVKLLCTNTVSSL